MQKFKFIILCLMIITTISFTLPSFCEETTYVWSNNSNSVKQNNTTLSTSSESSSSSDTLNLESPSAILIEQTTRTDFI